MNSKQLSVLSFACGMALGTAALAVPSFWSVGFSNASDLSADGQSTIGLLTNPPTPTLVRVNYGAAPLYIPAPTYEGDLHASDDLGVLVMLSPNTTNAGGLNCFLGNTVADQTPPCTPPDTTHRYSASTGWVNTGTFPRAQTPPITYANYTGPVWVGGTRCGSGTVSPSEVSGNGRFVVGSGYFSTSDPRTGGNAPSGLCGALYLGGVFDATTGVWTPLARQPGATLTYAMRTSFDGSVVVGKDSNHTCAWRGGAQVILDPAGYGNDVSVTRDGTSIAAQNGAAGARTLYKWTWNGSAWTSTNLGLPPAWVDPATTLSHPCLGIAPSGISDDGNTIVGTAYYDAYGFGSMQRLFIWRPSINSGVPMDLLDYVRSQLPQGDTTLDGLVFASAPGTTYVIGCSADGNAILTSFQDQRSPGTGLTFEQGVIHLDSVACDGPRDLQDHSNQAVGNLSNTGIVLNFTVSGTWPLNFQWQQESAPGVWVDLQDDHPNVPADSFDFHGTLTSKFIVGHLSGTHWGNYRCVVTNACGSITSAAANVSCGAPGVVAPVNRTSCVGNNVTLSAQAIGLGTLTFQWYKGDTLLVDGFTPSGSFLSGSSTADLTVAGLTLADTGPYKYTAANSCASVTSAPGTLSVTTSSAISTQPVDVYAHRVDTKYFQVGIPNPDLLGFTFQWRKNGVALSDGPTGTGSSITGSTSGGFYASYLYIHDITPEDAGAYDCVVSGGGCSGDATSAAGHLVFVCPADLDNGTQVGSPDGGVTIDDLLYFLVVYEQGNVRADLDDGSGTGTPDGAVTIDDLLFFLVHYEGGC